MPDAFDTLGLPARFDLTPAQIQRAYLARTARLHPDAGAGGDGEEDAAEVARRSAELNGARAAIEHLETRANLLLARLGGPSKEADRALPAGFLMEIMETREQVEAARASGDAAELERWRAWARDERARYAAEAGRLLDAGNSPENLAGVRRHLNAWRYIERLIEQLDPEYDPARADFGR